MKSSREFAVVVVCLLQALCLGCDEPSVRLPPKEVTNSDASATVEIDAAVPGDRKAECDQAEDGTKCGASGTEQHCIFGACVTNVCGDGFIAGKEQCDDGDQLDGDDCPSHCGTIECRDGKLDPGEECDDGNNENADGCTNRCTVTACGNKKVDAEGNEECDDGNQVDTDGCSNVCKNVVCGNKRRDPGEICDGEVGEQVCNATCSALVTNTCKPCMEKHCRDYLGEEANIDPLKNCYESTDAFPFPMKDFLKKCVAMDQCLQVHGDQCWTLESGAISCFCGPGVSAGECSNIPPKGPCAEEFLDASGCRDDPDNPSNCTINLYADDTLPSGQAILLDVCRRQFCVDACGIKQ